MKVSEAAFVGRSRFEAGILKENCLESKKAGRNRRKLNKERQKYGLSDVPAPTSAVAARRAGASAFCLMTKGFTFVDIIVSDAGGQMDPPGVVEVREGWGSAHLLARMYAQYGTRYHKFATVPSVTATSSLPRRAGHSTWVDQVLLSLHAPSLLYSYWTYYHERHMLSACRRKLTSFAVQYGLGGLVSGIHGNSSSKCRRKGCTMMWSWMIRMKMRMRMRGDIKGYEGGVR